MQPNNHVTLIETVVCPCIAASLTAQRAAAAMLLNVDYHRSQNLQLQAKA
jgi:hypothetical protein